LPIWKAVTIPATQAITTTGQRVDVCLAAAAAVGLAGRVIDFDGGGYLSERPSTRRFAPAQDEAV
jgi:hypothetical protein